jgi:hypothetical protein
VHPRELGRPVGRNRDEAGQSACCAD